MWLYDYPPWSWVFGVGILLLSFYLEYKARKQGLKKLKDEKAANARKK